MAIDNTKYEEFFFGTNPDSIPLPEPAVPLSEFILLSSETYIETFAEKFKRLIPEELIYANRLPFFNMRPSDGSGEGWVIWGREDERVYSGLWHFKSVIYERGAQQEVIPLKDAVEAAYYILSEVILNGTQSTYKFTQIYKKDRIANQRILLTLCQSCKVFNMLSINRVFGLRLAVDKLMWASRELQMSNIFPSFREAFLNRDAMVTFLCLSGMEVDLANEIYDEALR